MKESILEIYALYLCNKEQPFVCGRVVQNLYKHCTESLAHTLGNKTAYIFRTSVSCYLHATDNRALRNIVSTYLCYVNEDIAFNALIQLTGISHEKDCVTKLRELFKL